MQDSSDIDTSRLLTSYPPRAAQLIVTIYGDVVEPRGGAVWMGNLINVCSGFGVNESLVRTAVSRLVDRGQLSGTREGRRSFYALTPSARTEYLSAANLFFGSVDDECGWVITHCVDETLQVQLLHRGFVSLEGNIFAAPDREVDGVPGAAFRAAALEPNVQNVRDLVFARFALEALSARYAAFVERFNRLTSNFHTGLDGGEALRLRLALMHSYREIRLRDPRLPPSALPANWPGEAARRLFAELYLALAPIADHYVAREFQGKSGSLPERTDTVNARLNTLKAGL